MTDKSIDVPLRIETSQTHSMSAGEMNLFGKISVFDTKSIFDKSSTVYSAQSEDPSKTGSVFDEEGQSDSHPGLENPNFDYSGLASFAEQDLRSIISPKPNFRTKSWIIEQNHSLKNIRFNTNPSPPKASSKNAKKEPIVKAPKDLPPSPVIYLYGFDSKKISLTQLFNLLECFGNIKKGFLQTRRNFAFVEYSSQSEADFAMAQIEGLKLGEFTLGTGYVDIMKLDNAPYSKYRKKYYPNKMHKEVEKVRTTNNPIAKEVTINVLYCPPEEKPSKKGSASRTPLPKNQSSPVSQQAYFIHSILALHQLKRMEKTGPEAEESTSPVITPDQGTQQLFAAFSSSEEAIDFVCNMNNADIDDRGHFLDLEFKQSP